MSVPSIKPKTGADATAALGQTTAAPAQARLTRARTVAAQQDTIARAPTATEHQAPEKVLSDVEAEEIAAQAAALRGEEGSSSSEEGEVSSSDSSGTSRAEGEAELGGSSSASESSSAEASGEEAVGQSGSSSSSSSVDGSGSSDAEISGAAAAKADGDSAIKDPVGTHSMLDQAKEAFTKGLGTVRSFLDGMFDGITATGKQAFKSVGEFGSYVLKSLTDLGTWMKSKVDSLVG